MSGAVDLLVPARTALLDALEALAGHHDALVLVGAQAIYLQTENAPVALAEATKDSDLPAHWVAPRGTRGPVGRRARRQRPRDSIDPHQATTPPLMT